MRLYRNLPDNAGGKFLVIDNREGVRERMIRAVQSSVHSLDQVTAGRVVDAVLQAGKSQAGEFFCIALRDANAEAALNAYAINAHDTDPEFAGEVWDLAKRSGPNHPECKIPD